MISLTVWGEEGDENSHINEIIKGIKTAFCSPQCWYGSVEDEPLAEPGNQMILKDPSGKDRLLIEITEIRYLEFGNADENIARAVLDCDLQDFRDAHRFYWEEDLNEENVEMNDDLPIVIEFFKIIKVF